MTTRPASSSAFLNRETSWLEFNRRVLDEARDPKNPLLERLRFFCIFHSNLDEFFMVRVASLMHRIGEGDSTPDAAGLTPYNQLEMVLSRVRELESDSYTLYNDKLLPALAKEKIRILSKEEISPDQQQYLDEYFDREIYPVLTPLAIELGNPPHLLNLSFNLAVLLDSEEKGPERRLAVVQLPGRLPGLCRLPHGEGVHVCWMNDAVRARISRLF